MQSITNSNIAEDNSYPQKDQNKFKHWYEKWTSGRIPILWSLAIEVLSPAKLYSKFFHSEDIDSVEAWVLVSQSKI